jgi:hypothetical protein
MTAFCKPDDSVEAEWLGTEPDLETREWSKRYALAKREAREEEARAEAARAWLEEATPSVCDTEDADGDEDGTRTPSEPERLSGSLDVIIVPSQCNIEPTLWETLPGMEVIKLLNYAGTSLNLALTDPEVTASEAVSAVLARIRAVTEEMSETRRIPLYTFFKLPEDIDNKLDFEAARLHGVSGIRSVGPDDDLDGIVGDSIETVDGWLPEIEPSYLRRDCGSDALAYLREVASRLTALRSQVRTATEDGSV